MSVLTEKFKCVSIRKDDELKKVTARLEAVKRGGPVDFINVEIIAEKSFGLLESGKIYDVEFNEAE